MLAASHGHCLTHKIDIICMGEDANIQESIVDTRFRGWYEAAAVATDIANDEEEKLHFVCDAVEGDFGLMRRLSITSQSLG